MISLKEQPRCTSSTRSDAAACDSASVKVKGIDLLRFLGSKVLCGALLTTEHVISLRVSPKPNNRRPSLLATEVKKKTSSSAMVFECLVID
jgi:hypothetical protein